MSYIKKKFIYELPDIFIGILACIIPVLMMISWQVNNSGLPIADANDFLNSSGHITSLFYNGEYLHGFYELYSNKPYRPSSFYLILFPFMLISGNDILFTATCVHALCLAFIVLYSFFIFQLESNSRVSSFLGAIIVGLLSHSFFPGGSLYMLFAETAFTPAILAVIYHLIKSDYLTNKKHSILFLVALSISFTIRPVESFFCLIILFSLFFFMGYRNKIYSKEIILKTLKFLIFTIFLLSLRGLDVEVDHRIANLEANLDSPKSSRLFAHLFYGLILLIFIVFIPNLIRFFRKIYKDIVDSRKENYLYFTFSIFSILMFLWFIDAFRDTYIWVYETNFGKASSGSILQLSNLYNPVKAIKQLIYNIKLSGYLPLLGIITMILISIIFEYLPKKIKGIKVSIFNKDLYLYLISIAIIPVLLFIITAQNSPRKFALIYIIIFLISIIVTLSFKKFKILRNIFLIFIISSQILSINLISRGYTTNLTKKVTGSIIQEPKKISFEMKLNNLIYKERERFSFKEVSLTSWHPKSDIDIFTLSLLLNIDHRKNSVFKNKRNIHDLPIVFKTYAKSFLYSKLKKDALLIVNPYGSMDFSKDYAEKFKKESSSNRFNSPQFEFHGDLLHLYFSKKLLTKYNYIIADCVNLNNYFKDNKVREGCLLVKKNLLIKKNGDFE